MLVLNVTQSLVCTVSKAGTSTRRQHVFTVYVVNELKLLPEQSLRVWIQLLCHFLNDGIYGTFIWKLRNPFRPKDMIIYFQFSENGIDI